MTETLKRDPIEARLRTTLRAKAAQVAVADETFDLAVLPTPIQPERPRRRAVWLVGVLGVAAAVAGALIVAGSRGAGPVVATKSSAPVTTAASGPNPITAPLLAPTWVPDGQQLWFATAQPETPLDPIGDQLFGTVGPDGALAPGLLVELQAAPDGSDVGSGTPVTVRGVAGVTRDSKDAGTGTYAIEWVEAHTDVRVTVRGASVDQAVAAIDALRPRGANLINGFDPAPNPGAYALLSEHLRPSSAPSVAATFEYAPAATGGDPAYTVLTSTIASYPEYERVWMAGGRNADGTTWENDPQTGYYVVSPDGHEVIVRAKDPSVGTDVLAHIANRASVLDESEAAALAAGAQARLTALPSIGSLDLPSGRVDRRGTNGLETLCLTEPGASPACADPYIEDASDIETNGGLPSHALSAMIADRWYVLVAGDSDPVISQRPGAQQSDLPVESGVIGSTHIALVAVPDGIDRVNILVPNGSNGFVGSAAARPSS